MNFLALCKRTRAECHLNGTGPASVLLDSNPKDMQNIINWVADAWRELQGTRSWQWQWENPTLTMLAGTAVLAQSIAPTRYDKEATYFLNGGGFLDYLPWERFHLIYPANQIQDGTPTVWSVRPDLALVTNAKPYADTLISVERYANPTELAADTDTPGLPTDLHLHIVWSAVKKYAAHEEAGSLFKTASDEANRIYASILDRCLPEYTLGGPLA